MRGAAIIKSENQRHVYFAFLALEWMRGMPIRDLVKARLEFKKTAEEEELVNDEIRDLFREIEEELRYRYVKYTGIYLQVLSRVLTEKGETERAEKLLPRHMFLEFGASDKVLINLMSLGLSRTSAILLNRTVSFNSNMALGECKQYLGAINLSRIAIPRSARRKFLVCGARRIHIGLLFTAYVAAPTNSSSSQIGPTPSVFRCRLGALGCHRMTSRSLIPTLND
jgi:hypothetical protein